MNKHPDNVSDADFEQSASDLDATEHATDAADSETVGTDHAVDPGSVIPAAVDSGPEPVRAAAPRHGLRRKVLLVAAAATIGLLAVGGGTAAAMAKHVTITVDGEQREITTLAGSVRARCPPPGCRPASTTCWRLPPTPQIADGAQIALERARLLSLTINGQQREIWTTADTVERGAASSSARIRPRSSCPPTVRGKSRSTGWP